MTFDELIARMKALAADSEGLSEDEIRQSIAEAWGLPELQIRKALDRYNSPVMLDSEDGRAGNHPDFQRVAFTLNKPYPRR